MDQVFELWDRCMRVGGFSTRARAIESAEKRLEQSGYDRQDHGIQVFERTSALRARQIWPINPPPPAN